MDTFDVVPLVGVTPIKLGMSREESRAAMALPVHPFTKTPADSTPVDTYADGCLQVFFSSDDYVEFIELSAPINAVYHGMSVFQTQADDLIAAIGAESPYDPDNPELGYSYIFPDLELSLWRPTMPEEEQSREDTDGRYFATVGVGVRGYFAAGMK